MTDPAHARAKAVFLAALERPAAERKGFVAATCGEDLSLRHEVELLLAFHRTSSTSAPTTITSSSQVLDLVPRLRSEARDTDTPTLSAPRIASHVVSRAARRLELVCVVTIASLLVLWLGVNVLRGELGNELASMYQWGPPVTALVASLAMLIAARSGRINASTLLRIGLVYEVVISVALTGAAYFGAFEGLTADDVRLDRVGLGYVAPWTLFFTVLVPARPREALGALVLSASAVPAVYLEQVSVGAAPSLPMGQFLPIFVWPYAAGVVLSYIAARVVHQLGVEVRHAQELGAYRLETRLGEGGMGEVWRASHRMLARPAAMKVIRRDVLARDPALAAGAIARFEREARVIARLQSPHTVEIYDFGTTDSGALYYAMELLDGLDLGRLVRQCGPLPPSRAIFLLRQVCASLEEAHAHGLVHRDVSPGNVYVCRRGLEHDVVKVLDFGLVKRAVARDSQELEASGGRLVVGTPGFIAPEAIVRPDRVDARADIYAVGCVAFYLLTGRPPVEEADAELMLRAAVERNPIPPSAVAPAPMPKELDALVLECLARRAEDRPQSVAALAERLAVVPVARAWAEADAREWWRTYSPERPDTL